METASVLVGDIVVENMFLLICLDLFGIIFHSILLDGLNRLEIGVTIKWWFCSYQNNWSSWWLEGGWLSSWEPSVVFPRAWYFFLHYWTSVWNCWRRSLVCLDEVIHSHSDQTRNDVEVLNQCIEVVWIKSLKDRVAICQKTTETFINIGPVSFNQLASVFRSKLYQLLQYFNLGGYHGWFIISFDFFHFIVCCNCGPLPQILQIEASYK